MQVEALLKFSDPLFDKVGRTQHCHPFDLAAIQELASDQAGLDGLADTHIVSDQQAHWIKAQSHQQWHQLIGPRLDRQVAEATEWASATTQGHTQGIR